MASASALALSAIIFLVLHQTTTASDFLSPLLSPIFDDVCKEVECGKGKCNASQNNTLLFECVCDPGWKQADHNLKFLPCIIPNCTFNFACEQAPSPVQSKAKANDSLLDPCRWTDCGGGSCNRTSTFTYSCECGEGYNNLLNVSAFPCFKECALGMDCANLGIPVSNSSSPQNPALADSGKNQAGLNIGISYRWITLTVLFSTALWI